LRFSCAGHLAGIALLHHGLVASMGCSWHAAGCCASFTDHEERAVEFHAFHTAIPSETLACASTAAIRPSLPASSPHQLTLFPPADVGVLVPLQLLAPADSVSSTDSPGLQRMALPPQLPLTPPALMLLEPGVPQSSDLNMRA
jgi:hypothetical protein